MKAVRLHKFHSMPAIDEVPEPAISGPFDVVVRIGGAGVCRTDLHIMEGQWDAAMGTPLPYILGHAAHLHGPRMPLDGIFLTYTAFVLACLWPPTARLLWQGPPVEERKV